MQFRRSVRSSSVNAGMLPAPDPMSSVNSSRDSTIDADTLDHYVPLEDQVADRAISDSLASNSSDEIAARYAEHEVRKTPAAAAAPENRVNPSARSSGFSSTSCGKVEVKRHVETDSVVSLSGNEVSSTKLVTLYDTNDIALPVTTAPAQPNVGQAISLMTSMSASGSVGGASAATSDAEYLAVTVDQQPELQVSKCTRFSVFLCDVVLQLEWLWKTTNFRRLYYVVSIIYRCDVVTGKTLMLYAWAGNSRLWVQFHRKEDSAGAESCSGDTAKAIRVFIAVSVQHHATLPNLGSWRKCSCHQPYAVYYTQCASPFSYFE